MSIFRRRPRQEQEIAAEPPPAADYTGLPDAVQALFGMDGTETRARTLFPNAAAEADEAEARRRRTEQEIDDLLKGKGNPVNWIGKQIRDEGIFVGRFEMKGAVSKTFNVFAAPEDLSKYPTDYYNTVVQIASLMNWHGHKGMRYESDEEIFAALGNGSYSMGAGWIIPPASLMKKAIGALKDSFDGDNGHAMHHPGWYWTSTKSASFQLYIRPSDGHQGNSIKDQALSCRPIRLVACQAEADSTITSPSSPGGFDATASGLKNNERRRLEAKP